MSGATVAALLAEGAGSLHGPEARFEAELLLGHALGRDRAWLFAHARDVVTSADHDRFLALCRERAHGRPVAHLLGRRGFWTLDLEVTADTLVPRPDTELLVEAALERIPAGRHVHVADLGTGTGAIALAIASERPMASVLATDLSTAALDVARRNATRHRITTVRFAQGDWLAPLAGPRYTVIASNPPYIPEHDPHLRQGDLRFEPHGALASGSDGLDALRTITTGAPALLQPGGWLLVEHGHDQGGAVRGLFARAGFTGICTLQDLEQRDRVTLGQRP